MANNETEKLVIRYLRELRKAIASPVSLSVDLFSIGVIPHKVYDDAISTDGSLTTQQKIHAICDALLKSVAITPTLLVAFVEVAVDNSPIMSDVCARIKQEPLYATLEEKVMEERARIKALREREKQDKLREESGAGSMIDDQQLSPTPSCSSNEGGTVDTPSSVKKVRIEVPFRVKRNFDVLRGRYGGVFSRTFNLMKTCSLEEIKVYLFAGFKEMRDEIEDITCMDELKALLLKKTSFLDYTILEDLAKFLELADAQKYLREYATFQDQMYGEILAEEFAVEAKNEHIKDHETKIVFVLEWAEEKGTLLEFQKMMRQAFQNADRFIKLKAVHHSLFTFICAAPTWTVGSLILVAKDSIDILRKLGVVKLTIGQEVILDDRKSKKVTELDVPKEAESSHKVVEVTEEASESLQTFQQFFDRLTYTIRRPDLLAQDLREHGIIDQSTELQVTTHRGERLARAQLLLNAVESKIAGSKGREVLTEFCHALMRDLHLRFLGQEMALQANIVQVGSFSDALPDHLRVFEKYYLPICTTIEHPEILAKQLLHDELITENDNLQMSEEPLEKAAFLLDAVERKIAEGGWEMLRTFLHAMIRHKELQSVAEEIIQTEHLTQVTLEEKVIEERAGIKALHYKLGEESVAGSMIDDQQLSPLPSCSSNEGGTVDTLSSVKEVRIEVPFRVKRNFDILRARYGGVFIRTFNLMETCNLEEIKVYLFAGFEEMRSEIKAITSMDELKTFLLQNSSFTNYTIMEDLAQYLELADAQMCWSEYATFQDQMYGEILAEDFAVAAIDEYTKDHKTKIVFMVEWAEEQNTLLEFLKMLRQAFQNAGRCIKLIAVHH